MTELSKQQDNHGGDGPQESFGKGLARAFGGAIIFSLPILMTMEMWWLGFYMAQWKMALLMIVTIPLLIGLSYFVGFRDTFRLKEDALDAFVAYAVGFAAALPVLFLFTVIDFDRPITEVIQKVSLQAIPGSMGALLAQSQLGGQQPGKQKAEKQTGYAGELFIMLVGALFLSFNLAPTEEMVLIAYKMNSWHLLGLMFLSILIMHAFVYSLAFKGQVKIPSGVPFWSVLLRYTVVGYAIAILISFYMLWTFDRTAGLDVYRVVKASVVLAFPASVGAAAARLII
ncbi:MAG: TIGR02587 family membrane protein [Flavisolibacter sp.]